MYVMFSVLSSDMVNYDQNFLLEIEANEKLFSLITTMEKYLKRPNLSETSTSRIGDETKSFF